MGVSGPHNSRVETSVIALQEVLVDHKKQGRTSDRDGGLAGGGDGEATNAAFADFMREVTMQRSV